MTADHSNPLKVSLRYTFNSPSEYPTEILANRFQSWRAVIKDLLSYLKEFVSVQEEIIRQQRRLQQAVKITPTPEVSHGSGKDDSTSEKFFLPVGNGSIQDIPAVLTKFHQQNITNCSKTLKEINHTIVPKLDELRKDLLVKIKEIRNLQNDFQTNLGKEVNETKQLLAQFNNAIDFAKKQGKGASLNESDLAKNDPYIIKIKLDKQLKKQLNEESYLYDAYANLQTAGAKLESIIVSEIQNYISLFLNLVEAESHSITDFLVPSIQHGFLSKESSFEWDSFISRNLRHNNGSPQNKGGTFIDLSFPTRQFSDLSIPGFESPFNVAVREGTLERRSKFLKSYSSGWYVLTSNYLHEFKSSDIKKDSHPVMSLSLDSCTVTEHSKDDGKSSGIYKFVLSSKGSNGLIHRNHNWVFRTDKYEKMINWYNDLKKLTSLQTTSARARYVEKNVWHGENRDSLPKKVTRASSLKSTSTNPRSIRSSDTANSGMPRVLESVRSRPISQTTSIANANRLSSTFSSRNNFSPRPGNMINSDGTIITPVDTNRDNDLHHPTKVDSKDSENGNQETVSLASPLPQTYLMSTPVQGQQFYDPVSQQFYTLTPSAPGPGTPPNDRNGNSPSYSDKQQRKSVPVAQNGFVAQHIPMSLSSSHNPESSTSANKAYNYVSPLIYRSIDQDSHGMAEPLPPSTKYETTEDTDTLNSNVTIDNDGKGAKIGMASQKPDHVLNTT